jgi:D-aminopeptidase
VRARDLGIVIGGLEPGEHDAITDVPGVRVGHTTVIEGDDVRTGVTVVVPHAGNVWADPVYAAYHRLNGNGEMTGLPWIEEVGLLHSPVGITNTHSVGVVRDALVEIEVAEIGDDVEAWALPVVAETWDGTLNDVDGFHVTAEHAKAAYAAAAAGPVAEGSVGGGTGMVCHDFKGGIGTASRTAGAYTVGVLVQANHGRRERFLVNGVPVGLEVGEDVVPGTDSPMPPGSGSIIGIVATDAPLLPLQCRRLAQRASFGVARTGGVGENSSGDLFLAFATGNHGMHRIGGDARDEPALRRRHRGRRGGHPQRDPGLADDDRSRPHRPHAAGRPAAGGAGEVRTAGYSPVSIRRGLSTVSVAISASSKPASRSRSANVVTTYA